MSALLRLEGGEDADRKRDGSIKRTPNTFALVGEGAKQSVDATPATEAITSFPTTKSQIEQTRPEADAVQCNSAVPGRGSQMNGVRYILSKMAFAESDDVGKAIKTMYGEKAELADWVELKRLLSDQTSLADFLDSVGMPVQGTNQACNNYLVSYQGQTRSGGLRLFVARHNGKVPNNWLVLDFIGDNIIDLGRWSYTSPALIAIRDNPSDISTAHPQ